MRAIKKTLLCALTFALAIAASLSFNSIVLAKDKLSQKDKLLEMGLKSEEISKLYDGQKEFLEKVYDDSEGKVKRLTAKEVEEVSLQGINDIDGLFVFGEVDQTDSKYTYAHIVMVGNVETYVESSGIGVAFSDGWTILDHEAVTYFYDFWGDEVFEWGELVDAVPKSGVAFAYEDYSLFNDGCGWTLKVDLRKPASEGGTTDIVGKVGYSTSSITWGATISSSPGITFTPTSKIYQKATTNYFDYPED